MAKYTTDLTNTQINLELTKPIEQIPVADANFTDDYWLGWINYDNLPNSYHISAFIWDTKDSGVTGTTYLNDVTKRENVPIGYCSPYMTTENATYDQGIVLTYNSESQQWGRIRYTPAETTYSTALTRLPNRLDVNTSQLGNELWIGIRFMIAGSNVSETWINVGIVSGLINDEPFDITMGTYTTTKRMSDFNDYKFIVEENNGLTYTFCIFSWRCSVNDPSVSDTGGQLGSIYQHIHPMIRVHEDFSGQEKAAIMGFRESPNHANTATICQYDGYIRGGIGTIFESDYFNWIFGGYIGSFDIEEWKTYRQTDRMYKPEGAVTFFLDSSSGTYDYGFIRRIFTRDEIYKMCAIQHRFTTVNPNVYSNAGQIYAKVNLDTNEFLTEFVYGENFRDLTDWQYIGGNIGDHSFDPSDIPDITPPGPSPIDTEPKYSGDPTNGFVTRTVPSSGTIYYALNATELANFRKRLWDQPKSFYDAIQIAGKQSTSIFEYITCLRYYPLNINWKRDSSGPQPVLMGTGALFKEADGDTNYQLSPITYHERNIGHVATWTFSDPRYHWRGNFLDYSPYTKISIYLPYAGTVELSPEQIASHGPINQARLTLSIGIDAPTGSLTYFLFNEANTVLVQKTVKIGVDLPISGNDSARQAQAILDSQFKMAKQILGNYTGGASAALSGASSGNLIPAIAGAATSTISNTISSAETYLQNSLAHKQVPVEIGSFGGVLSNISHGQIPYITIHRQKISNPDNYGHTTGYLVEGTYTINSLNGFTKCKNVDVSGVTQATDKEKAQIKQIMESGFYC